MANFEIPARFSFRPFGARWEIRTAELMGWVEPPKPSFGRIVKPLAGIVPEHERVVARVEAGLNAMLGLDPSLIEIDRADIPHDLLAPHENRKTSPDISGRFFPVLVCAEPEFKTSFPSTPPGDVEQNAWTMRDEFLNLCLVEADDFDWPSSLCGFLNRWGLWNYGLGFHLGSAETPGFALLFPHLLREKRSEYRRAMESKNARKWLSTAPPLNFRAIEERPYFLVERFFCEDAIQATITIDHLRKRRFGFCKRCGKLFEQQTEHKMIYCSRACASAASVKRWREQRKAKQRKGAQGDAKG